MIYKKNIDELENIVEQLESSEEQIGFQEYTKMAKRADKLLKDCKKKLHTVDEELQKLFDE